MNKIKINELKKQYVTSIDFPKGLTIALNEYDTEEDKIYRILFFNHEDENMSEYGQYATKEGSLNDFEGLERHFAREER